MELIAEPERPVYDQRFALRLLDAPPGGSPGADAAPREDVWRRLLAFLRAHAGQ